MARRSRRRSSPPRRSRYRARERVFIVTCAVCGNQMEVPVQPPAGVELTCMECLKGAAAPTTDTEADTEAEARGVAR